MRLRACPGRTFGMALACVLAAAFAGLVALSCARAQPVAGTEGVGVPSPEELQQARERMVSLLVERERLRSEAVIAALRAVQRHLFVPQGLWPQAYFDTPLPIGFDQTISAPSIVAMMTELIQPGPEKSVLEVGTGSGYQAAVLAQVCKHVYTIEIVQPLAESAEKRLRELGYKNVTVRWGDGYRGWPEHAPFDGIMVTCAPTDIPSPLVEQLKEGGRMVIPVGPAGSQELYVLRKVAGAVERTAIVPVLFVPMTGEAQQRP
jgi:protein-L-isoaspartate(D-aspartate) O-methyltransferase